MKRKLRVGLACAIFLCFTAAHSQVLINENFSTATTTTPPTGWVNNDLNSSTEVWTFNNPGGRTLNSPISSPAAIFDSDFNGSGGAEDAALESPPFNASTGIIVLSFDHYFQSGFGGSYAVEVFDGTDWDTIIMGGGSSTSNPQSEQLDITALTNGSTSAKVRFHWKGNYSWYWILDNVKVEAVSCSAPSGLGATNLTSTSADLFWTGGGASNWNLEYGPKGFALGSGTKSNETNDTVALVGLTSGIYDFYVRDSCGLGNSSGWSGPFTFGLNNSCASAITLTSNGTYWAAGPSAGGGCYNCGSSAANANWYKWTAPGNGLLDVSACGLSGKDTRLWVYDGTCAALTQVASDDDGCTSADGYASQVIGVVVSSGVTYYLEWDDNWNDDPFQFTITFTAVNCPVPSALGATNVTTTSADLYWTSGGASDWNLEYGPTGFSRGAGTSMNLTNDTVSVGGLSANTTYDFYVRDSCGAGNSSTWVGPFSFTTPCLAISSFPSTEDFEGATTGAPGVVPSCWSRTNSSTYRWQVDVSTTPSSNTGPSVDHTLGTTAGKFMYVEASNGSGGDRAYLNSPSYDVTGLTVPQLVFYYHMYGAFITRLQVEVWNAGTSTWDSIYAISGPQQSASADPWLKASVDLTPYGSANTLIRFWSMKSSAAGNTYEGDVALDDITVREAPNCIAPTSPGVTNITSTSADFYWTTGGASDWNIEYGPVGFTPGSGTMVNATNDTISITGLSQLVDYEFYVRDSCGLGDVSAWVKSPAFMTPCGGPLSGTYSINSGLATGGTNYSSFNDLAYALGQCGVSGAVTVNVAQGTYTERVAFDTIVGVSSTNSITIQADATNTLPVVVTETATASADNYIIQFNNTDWITVDGITLTATGATYSTTVEFTGNNGNITIQNCILNALDAGSTSTNHAVIYDNTGSANKSSNITISGNEINNGSYGIYLYGVSTTDYESGHLISDNVIQNFYNYGIRFYYQDGGVISGNTLTSGTSSVNTTVYGIYNYYSDNSSVTGNNVVISGSSTNYGIYCYLNDASASAPNLIANNMVTCDVATGTVYGIYVYNNYYTDVVYNSVNLTSGTTTAGRAIYLNSSTTGTYGFINLQNNNFVNTGGGYAVEVSSGAVTLGYISSSDYNNAYVSGATVVRVNNSNYADLASYQTAVPTFDQNSVSVAPLFAGPADLHVSAPGLNNAGSPFAGITDDIDGDPRSLTTPDIGADEFAPPSCLPLASAGLTVITVYSDSATVSWAPGSGTLFNLEYDLTGYTQGSGTSITGITDTFYTITGLTPASTYDFYVQNDCGAGGVSAWAGPVSFSTLCLTDTIPFIEDFTSGIFPVCWDRSSTTDVHLVTTCASRGNVIEFNYTEEAITPSIDASGAQSIKVGYYLSAGACTNDPEDNEHFHVDYWDGAQWVQAKDYDGTWPQAFVWDSFIVPQSALTSDFKVRFDMIDGTTDAWHIDSVVIDEGPACAPPTALGAFNVSSNTAEIFWTTGGAANWNYEYGLTGFTIGAGTRVNSINDTASIAGLTPTTTYDFYVRDSCGLGDVSSWAGPFSFTTACGAIVAPHLESFNSTSVPNCWTTYSSGTETFNFGSNTYGPSSDHTGGTSYYANVDDSESPSSSDVTLESPLFDVSGLTNPELRFYLASADATVTVSVDVWDGTIWNIGVFSHAAATVSTWDLQTVNLTPYASGDTIAVRFVVDENNGTFQNDIGIDDVEILSGPTCPAPSGLGADPTSGTMADIYWTTGGASNWNIQYGTGGFSLGAGTMVNAIDDTLSLTGLSTNLAYEFYVRDSCAIGDVSAWAGPFSFGSNITPCDNFDAYSTGLIDVQSNLINGWGGAGGDAEISTTYASSGANSLKIHTSGTNAFSDVVAEVGTYSSGVWNVALDLYVPATNGGYYNILHNYVSGGTSTWAIEVTLDANGTATVAQGTNGTGNVGTYNYTVGAWNTIEHIIDLDNDTAFIMVNGVATIGWQFSLGSANFGDQFNALNFYSTAPTGQTPLIYFDNFCITPYSQVSGACGVSNIANDTICAPGLTGFTTTPGNCVVYLDPVTSQITAAGDTLRISNLNDTTITLREAIGKANGGHVGPLTSIAATGFGNFSNGQWFTALDTIKIDSMTVMANGVTQAMLRIWTDDPGVSGTLVQNGKTFTTGSATADYQVPVGVVLMPGTYFMNVEFLTGAGQLFRATGGASYPYVLPGLMTIDSTNFSSQTRIYYTFDMVVSEVCLGDPVTVTSYIQGLSGGADQFLAMCDNGAAEDLTGYLSSDADLGGTFISTNAAAALSGNMFNPSILSAGTYQVYYTTTATVDCPADSALIEVEIQACQSCVGLQPPTLTPDTICGSGTVNLSATGGATDIVWYNTANEIVNYGNGFSPIINSTTEYKALSILSAGPSIIAGPPQSLNTNAYPAANFSNGQYITVAQDVRIDSAVFAVNGALDVVVAIQDAQRTDTLQVSKLISYTGADTAFREIGIYLTPGNYFISVIPIAGSGILWRPIGGANFPYGVSNVLTVDSSDFGPTRLYYLYDMRVSAACVSTLDSVNGVIVSGTNAGLSDTIGLCATITSADLETYLGMHDQGGTWYDDNSTGALTGSIFNPSMVPTGTYNFTYALPSVGGCPGDSATITVNVAIGDAGADSTGTVCVSGSSIPLKNYVSGSTNGTLANLDNAQGFIAGTLLAPGQAGVGTFRFRYTTPAGICPPDTAIITIVIEDNAIAGPAVSDTVCDSLITVDLTTFLDASATTGGSWVDVSGSGSLTGSAFNPNAVISGSTYIFRYVVATACGKDSTNISLYVKDCTIGLREFISGTLSVYPNPSKGMVYIKSAELNTRPVEIELYSNSGQLLLKRQVILEKETKLDLSNLADGIYKLKITSEMGTEVHQISKM